MPDVYHHSLQVPADAIDVQGHVNNLEYLRWMQDAAVAHSTAQGWPTRRYMDLGAGWVARSHWIEYRQPAFVGDQVTVVTWVAGFRKVRSLRKYEIVRTQDNALLAVAETDWAFVDLNQRAPARIPQEVADAFVVVAR